MIFKDWSNKNDIPTIDFLTDKTLKYIKHKDWYKKSNKLIKEFYPQDYKLFIDILSITSPLTNVKLNLLNTVQTVDSIKYKRTNNIVYGLANKWIKRNLDKYDKTKKFTGIKINNFAKSLRLIDYTLHMEQDYDTCQSLDKLCRAKRDMCIEYWLW